MIFAAEIVPDQSAAGSWRVEKINSDGGIDVTVFHGPLAQDRAIEYTAWKYPAESDT